MGSKHFLALGCFLFVCSRVQSQSTDRPAILRAKPLLEAAEDKPLKKLQKQRFNEALAEAQLSYKLFTQGVPGNYSPIDAGKRLQNAAVEVFSLKEAISFLTELHGYADAIEKNLEMRTKRNLAKASIQPVLQVELHKARQFRLEIEIQKLKLETGVK